MVEAVAAAIEKEVIRLIENGTPVMAQAASKFGSLYREGEIIDITICPHR